MTPAHGAVDEAEEVPPRSPSRVPPQDVEAEQSVLGAMLLSKDAIGDVAEMLTAADFYRPAHAKVFSAVMALYVESEPADAITVAGRLQDTGDLAKIGGAPYLHTLISAVPTAANGTYYARIVAERAKMRRLLEASYRITQMAQEPAEDADRTLDAAQQVLHDLTDRSAARDLVSLAQLLQPALDQVESHGKREGLLQGVPSGFTELDALLGGAQPGQMIVVAGRPGLGKSTLGLDWARHASIRLGLPSAIFSMEMSQIEITLRLLSAETKVPLHNLRTGRLSDNDWIRLGTRMGEIGEAPVYVDETANLTLMEIRAKVRRLQQRHDLRLVVVDYMQLMTSPKRVESRQQEVSELSRGLKLLAKEAGLPVIVVSQLNRGPEQRTDKRPQLSDLRESGAIEQDADVVILLHRDDYYDKESPRAGEADFIVAKHRNGPTDTVTVAAQLHYSRFVDMSIDGPPR